eukprot:CAMPEP_0119300812 /NCGR_PEP_ID=MMETSP1333-20130426/2708_1 /TAXON_ID=418940 /ORGANISM="Scyphosphaera apsteinii, Strain RCC1455" /LENGTH=107 /DNA_ID=CAMNT_0007302713 /DNA_START=447 /DNA_END=770 /DNA_ORIENTATION=+
MTPHLTAIARALATPSQKLLVLPTNQCTTGSLGHICSVEGFRPEIANPMEILHELLARRARNGAVILMLEVHGGTFDLKAPAEQEHSDLWVWSGLVAASALVPVEER